MHDINNNKEMNPRKERCLQEEKGKGLFPKRDRKSPDNVIFLSSPRAQMFPDSLTQSAVLCKINTLARKRQDQQFLKWSLLAHSYFTKIIMGRGGGRGQMVWSPAWTKEQNNKHLLIFVMTLWGLHFGTLLVSDPGHFRIQVTVGGVTCLSPPTKK